MGPPLASCWCVSVERYPSRTGSCQGGSRPPRDRRPIRCKDQTMPAHDVEMSIPTTKVVLHADVVFEIRSDDEKLGELHVSKGSIDWYASNARIPVKLTWEQFDRLMRDQRGEITSASISRCRSPPPPLVSWSAATTSSRSCGPHWTPPVRADPPSSWSWAKRGSARPGWLTKPRSWPERAGCGSSVARPTPHGGNRWSSGGASTARSVSSASAICRSRPRSDDGNSSNRCPTR